MCQQLLARVFCCDLRPSYTMEAEVLVKGLEAHGVTGQSALTRWQYIASIPVRSEPLPVCPLVSFLSTVCSMSIVTTMKQIPEWYAVYGV